MIDKKFIATLKAQYQKSSGERRQIISISNLILAEAKKAIFALHRGELEQGLKKLEDVEAGFANLKKKFGESRANDEGAYSAALEEYAEAKLLSQLMAGKKIGKISAVNVGMEGYLGGLCDVTGELVRFATNQAAAGKFSEVKRVKALMNEIMGELLDFDMTGYLRTKYDQARGNLRRIEQMDYEIEVRK